ncbi:hypothetical protein KFL_006880030 [Klebsormidium nitens]|uniref:Uncharacterized protein n=1 Tax=Klebsormidium nitens TaxID=105231 RepID=A0A1Y1INQ9_KLENI|nr:hypothetical protein KFL_006880030 [Klebsormidium nitens]|eukprot:GAQ90811.1 hypothetical protein KFL_006880030 [Klebsormidium nitens]
MPLLSGFGKSLGREDQGSVMGYDTRFTGRFALSRPLTAEESAILAAVHDHCHEDDLELPYAFLQKRTVTIEREVIGPLYVGESLHYLTEKFPSFYCQWTLSGNKRSLVWDKGEKFYNYVGWLEYLLSNFFAVRGVQLSGTVKWKGANRGDRGSITVEGNRIIVKMTHP